MILSSVLQVTRVLVSLLMMTRAETVAVILLRFLLNFRGYS